MKKYSFVFAAFAFAALGCSVIPEEDLQPMLAGGTHTVTLSAVMTKVGVENGSYVWQSGDVIGVFLSDGSIVPFTTTDSGDYVEFTGTVTDGLTVGSYAVMPYVEGGTYSISGSTANIAVPTTVKYSEGSLNMLMVGEVSEKQITFTPLGAAVRFSLSNIPTPTQKLVFESASSSAIAGKATLDLSAQKIESVTGSRQITVDISSVAPSSRTDLDVVFPLASGTDGFTVKAVSGGSEPVEMVKVSASKTIEAAPNMIISAPKVSFPAYKGLVGHWTFDDASNLLAAKVGCDLTAHGSISAVSGPNPSDGAVSAGVKGAYLSFDHQLPDAPDEFTMMMYVKLPAANPTAANNYWQLMEMSKGYNFTIGGNGDMFRFEFPGAATIPGDLNGASNDVSILQRRLRIDFAHWYRLILTQKAGVYHLYVDQMKNAYDYTWDFDKGTCTGNFNNNAGTVRAINTTANKARYNINGTWINLAHNIDNFVDNEIQFSEVALWNKELTKDEVYSFIGIKEASYTLLTDYSSASIQNSQNLNNNNVTDVSHILKTDNGNLPYGYVIDLGSAKKVGLVWWQIGNWGACAYKQVVVTAGNDLSDIENWTSLYEFTRRDKNFNWGSVYSINNLDSNQTYRYLKFAFPEMMTGFNSIAIAELNVYEKL